MTGVSKDVSNLPCEWEFIENESNLMPTKKFYHCFSFGFRWSLTADVIDMASKISSGLFRKLKFPSDVDFIGWFVLRPIVFLILFFWLFLSRLE